MFGSMGQTSIKNLGNGGTIDGDLVISGDLTVSGGGSLSFDEIIEGTQVIDVTSTEALLVRKNGDGGDILTVDTTNSKVIATELDISGNIDVDGTSNLDDVDIDGDVDISGSITNATWTGDVIASAYLDSDTAHLSGTQTFSGSKTFSANTIISSTNQLQFGDSGTYIHQSADGVLDLVSDTEIELTAGLIDIDTTTLDINGTAINFESSSADSPILTIKNTNAGDGSPRFYFNHDSSTPANNDELGQIRYYGDNSNGDSEMFVQVKVNATNVADGSEASKLSFITKTGGSEVNNLILDGGKVGIGIAPASNTGQLHIDGGSSPARIQFTNSATGQTSGDGMALGLDPDNNRFYFWNYDQTNTEFAVGGAVRFKIDADSVISLSNNDSGTGNTIFGHDAATPDSGGNYNIVIGEEASKDLTTGDGNISIGYQSLFKNTDKSYNVAIGGGALYFAKGHFNTGIGYYSGRGTDNYTGTNNISIGYQTAGDISGSRNISIGDYAGHTGTNNLTSGVNNVLIGVEAEVSAAGASNQIAIGYLAEAQADNSVTLGNENVTAVYMAQDSGAMVHSAGLTTSGAVLTQGMSDDTDRFVVTDDGSNYKGGIAKKSGSMGGLFVRGASSKIGVLTNSSYASNPSGDTEALMVSSADASTTFGGAIIPNAGINFPDTPVESADANTLDDYEEGLVTNLSITFGGNSASQTYNASRNQARYTKVGNRVFIGGFIELSAKGSSTGTAKISGLPFTIQNHTGANSAGSIGYMSGVSFADFPMLQGEVNTTNLFFSETTNAGTVSTLTEGNFTDSSNVIFSFHYNTQ